MGRQAAAMLATVAVMIHCVIGCCVHCANACECLNPDTCTLTCSVACDCCVPTVGSDSLCCQPQGVCFDKVEAGADSHPHPEENHFGCGHSKCSFILTGSPGETLPQWIFLLPDSGIASAQVDGAMLSPASLHTVMAPHPAPKLRLHLSLAVLII